MVTGTAVGADGADKAPTPPIDVTGRIQGVPCPVSSTAVAVLPVTPDTLGGQEVDLLEPPPT
ncbi:MAG: hypothetical protein ACYCVN_03760 [Acidimicrobiales bacterium]